MKYLIDWAITCAVCFSNIARELITSPHPSVSLSAENLLYSFLTLSSLVWNLKLQGVGRECGRDAEHTDSPLWSSIAPPLQ